MEYYAKTIISPFQSGYNDDALAQRVIKYLADRGFLRHEVVTPGSQSVYHFHNPAANASALMIFEAPDGEQTVNVDVITPEVAFIDDLLRNVPELGDYGSELCRLDG